MTGKIDKLVAGYAERLKESGAASKPDVLSDILRYLVGVSLEAAIEPVELAIRQMVQRGYRKPGDALSHDGYTMFAPDVGKDHRALAIHGPKDGLIFFLETDSRTFGTLFSQRTVPVSGPGGKILSDEDFDHPKEISVHRYWLPTTNSDAYFEQLVDGIDRGHRYSQLAGATQPAFFDRDLSTYIDGDWWLQRPDTCLEIFAALKAALAMCDLGDRMQSASETIRAFDRKPHRDPAVNAALWVGRHLASLDGHLPGEATLHRLDALKREMEDEAEIGRMVREHKDGETLFSSLRSEMSP